MLFTNDEQRLPSPNDNRYNGSAATDKHRHNCDSLQGVNAMNINDINDAAAPKQPANDLFIDDLDDDPYAELQSYLENVKVSYFYDDNYI